MPSFQYGERERPWCARVQFCHRVRYLGYFYTREEAEAAEEKEREAIRMLDNRRHRQ
jgi:hypothetical protein